MDAEKKLFFDTLQDVRRLVGQHRGEYAKDVMGLNKHNTKVPFTHLQGRRNKMHQRHQEEKQRAREEAIQYDSSMRLLNSSVMEIKRSKDSFEKNQYKFENVSTGKFGREKDGFLHISQQDLDRIHGKEEGDNRQRPNGKGQNGKGPKGKGQQKGKKRFIAKNKKFKGKGK
jgi:hypothetical protein